MIINDPLAPIHHQPVTPIIGRTKDALDDILRLVCCSMRESVEIQGKADTMAKLSPSGLMLPDSDDQRRTQSNSPRRSEPA